MRREDRVSRQELAALIKKLKARACLDPTDYYIINEVLRKTFALQEICQEGREPTDEELEELLTIPRPEKADG